ncbi:hypothetical protein RZS08_66965, partial [Arthrospira platensis SPKY1]|nr:hypothetical protein [Arthrospira platensis SPKY1]
IARADAQDIHPGGQAFERDAVAPFLERRQQRAASIEQTQLVDGEAVAGSDAHPIRRRVGEDGEHAAGQLRIIRQRLLLVDQLEALHRRAQGQALLIVADGHYLRDR